MKTIEWLTEWYRSNCNGDWEHNSTVKIETLDNPGWSIKIDLLDTTCEGKKVSIRSLTDDDYWYDISCDGEVFTACGGIEQLGFLLESFREFVEDR